MSLLFSSQCRLNGGADVGESRQSDIKERPVLRTSAVRFCRELFLLPVGLLWMCQSREGPDETEAKTEKSVHENTPSVDRPDYRAINIFDDDTVLSKRQHHILDTAIDTGSLRARRFSVFELPLDDSDLPVQKGSRLIHVEIHVAMPGRQRLSGSIAYTRENLPSAPFGGDPVT